jgi:hypothetical protein
MDPPETRGEPMDPPETRGEPMDPPETRDEPVRDSKQFLFLITHPPRRRPVEIY